MDHRLTLPCIINLTVRETLVGESTTIAAAFLSRVAIIIGLGLGEGGSRRSRRKKGVQGGIRSGYLVGGSLLGTFNTILE